MKAEIIYERLERYQAELETLLGPCDRTTPEGRKRHCRKSTLYGNMKRLQGGGVLDLLGQRPKARRKPRLQLVVNNERGPYAT